MGGLPVKVPAMLFVIPCRREPPMFHKRCLVALAPEERTYWKRLVACGSPKIQGRHRARIGLLCDQGPEGPAWTDARTVETVDVAAMTVRRAHPKTR